MALRIRTEFTGGPGAPLLNTLIFAGTVAADATAAVAVVRTFWAALAGLIADPWKGQVQPEVVSFTAADGDALEVFNAPTAQITFVASNLGLPQACQGLVRLRTGSFVDGREVRGRIFVPGLTTNSNVTGDLTPAANTAILTAANAMIAATPSLLVWQRPREADPAHLPHPVEHRDGSIHEVTSASVWSEFAILRSRRT